MLSSRGDGSRKAELILSIILRMVSSVQMYSSNTEPSISSDPLYSNDMSHKAEDCSLIHRRAVD